MAFAVDAVDSDSAERCGSKYLKSEIKTTKTERTNNGGGGRDRFEATERDRATPTDGERRRAGLVKPSAKLPPAAPHDAELFPDEDISLPTR